MEKFQVLCEMFYNAHYLPIALYNENGFVCSAGFYEVNDPYPFVLEKLLGNDSPALYASSDTGHYGLVKCADKNHYFVLGPTYSTPVTEEIIRAYIKKNAISPSQYGEIASFLGNIPQYTYNHFVNLLLYLHYTLTGEKLTITQAFGITDTQFQEQIGQQYAKKNYLAREEQKKHGTYDFEQHMLHLIKTGNVAQLEQFLLTAALHSQMNEGKLAESPLRQAKNLFIGLVTMIGKAAAIPGGMDEEQTYQLIDTYIQECEKLQTVESVKNLQYNMPIDFAKRVAQHKLPTGLSSEIHDCMQFISTHINEPIGVSDVVGYSGKSRAYLFQKFGQELDMNIGEYITHCRLQEAKSLLRYTDKPLSEISNYLCFSSQSYFQNVFKKHFGMTPMEYRKRTM